METITKLSCLFTNRFKKYLVAMILLFSCLCFSQNSSINYKAIVKDGNGAIIANGSIAVKLKILQGVALIDVYNEAHNVTTDANGIIILNIGEGTVIGGDYIAIDWASDTYSLNVMINTGSGFVNLGTSEFSAVPYAIQALNTSFKTSTNVTSNSVGDLATDDFVFGSAQLDDDVAITTDENRLFFDKSKGAFRVGGTSFYDWDEANLGVYSFGSGFNTTASGDYSVALGKFSIASGEASVSMGHYNQAIGENSIALGLYTEASGENSTAIGYLTDALGGNSTAMGYGTDATGENSTAMGDYTEALGENSTAMGYFTDAEAFASFAIGKYNIGGGSATTWVDTDPLFEVGNGSGVGSKSNAFEVKKNGDIYASGSMVFSSDRRLKKDIDPIAYGLKEVLAFKPVSYRWKKDSRELKSLGLIAQEVQPVIKEIVHQSHSKSDLLSVSYVELVPVLIKAIQEQQDLIENQNTKISDLTTQLKELQIVGQRLNNLEASLKSSQQ